MSAARKLFLDDGYAATRMETIAAAAGISKGTLYARYATKDALLSALIEQDAAFWSSDELPAEAPAPSNLRERLRFRARKIMELYCSEQFADCETLVSSATHLDELRRMYLKIAYQQAVKEIAQDIIDGADQRVEPPHAMEVADLLMAMLYGWARAKAIVERVSHRDAIAYADRAVDVLLDGRSGWRNTSRREHFVEKPKQ